MDLSLELGIEVFLLGLGLYGAGLSTYVQWRQRQDRRRLDKLTAERRERDALEEARGQVAAFREQRSRVPVVLPAMPPTGLPRELFDIAMHARGHAVAINDLHGKLARATRDTLSEIHTEIEDTWVRLEATLDYLDEVIARRLHEPAPDREQPPDWYLEIHTMAESRLLSRKKRLLGRDE